MKTNIHWDLLPVVNEDDLTLAYTGIFEDSMTNRIIDLSEAYLESHEQMGKLKRKASFLVAECFQNVVRHGSKETDTTFFSVGTESFIIRFKKNSCFIASENAIPNEQIEGLKSKLEEVNKYEKDELKAIYKQILEDGELSDKGGAGLGLIEMARKTGNKLHFSFKPLDDSSSVFYLMLVLEPVSEEDQSSNHDPILGEIEGFIKQLRMANQFLFFKGEFEQDIILPMIQMIEKNLESQFDHHSTKMKMYHAAVEIMQNIGHHSLLKDGKHTGILTVGKAEEGYVLYATNPVDQESKSQLEQMLADLKERDAEELNQKYRQKLRTTMKSDERSAGLGFIDLARISKSWDYDFDIKDTATLHFNYRVLI